MMPLIVIILPILTYSLTPIEADIISNGSNIECTNECVTKTYCIASDGSIGCHQDTLVQVQFTGTDNLNTPTFESARNVALKLAGNSVQSAIPWTISFQLVKSMAKIVYSCDKNAQDVTKGKVSQANGTTIEADSSNFSVSSSSYVNGTLTCDWILSPDGPYWPIHKGQPLDLFTDSTWRIELSYGGIYYAVAPDTSDLPIYHMRYLTCCNQLHGNSGYQLFSKQTNETTASFLLEAIGKPLPSNNLTVIFNNLEGQQQHLIIRCYLQSSASNISNNNDTNDSLISASLISNTGSEEELSQLLTHSMVDFSMCTWSQPLFVSGNLTTFNYTKDVDSLIILSDGKTVFVQTFTSSGSTATISYLIVCVCLFATIFSS